MTPSQQELALEGIIKENEAECGQAIQLDSKDAVREWQKKHGRI